MSERNKPIHATLMLEFTGTPEAGKTTAIHALKEVLEKQGWIVKILQEAAELLPNGYKKGSWEAHIWMRRHTVSQLSNAILILVQICT